MKQLLTIILFLTWMVGQGSVTIDTLNIHTIRLVDTTDISFTTRSLIDDKQNDTIPIIMLVCDTTIDSVSAIFLKEAFVTDPIQWMVLIREYKPFQSDRIYFLYGYEVREKYYYIGGPDAEPGQMMVNAMAIRKTEYIHVKYLDNNKQPLKPEIVVWDSKERRKQYEPIPQINQ